VGCAPLNHTHSGEDINSGKVSEARIDDSIARDNEVPFMRAQRLEYDTPRITDYKAIHTANKVSITAPTDGFLFATGSITLYNASNSQKTFQVVVDGARSVVTGIPMAYTEVTVNYGQYPDSRHHVELSGSVPIKEGEYTITLEVRLLNATDPSNLAWFYNFSTLSVIFFPDNGRSGVDDPVH
jgi:hypothetical protein